MIFLIMRLRIWLARLRQEIKVRRTFPDAVIHGGVYVDQNSTIGRHVVLFDRTVLISSHLGDHTYVQQDSQICNATIGKFCSIGMGVHVGLPLHSLEMASTHPAFYLRNTPLAVTFSDRDRIDVMKPTDIGHDVWLGQGAMVMTGIRIGTGAVIGAGAVVTKDVPPYAVVVGVPAKVLRYRFDAEMRERLLASRWWEMSDEWLQSHVDEFSDPARLLATLDREGH